MPLPCGVGSIGCGDAGRADHPVLSRKSQRNTPSRGCPYPGGVGKRTNAVAASGWRAVDALERTREELERIASDIDDRHLAGRLRDASDRIRWSVEALRRELDKAKPDRRWVATFMGVAGLAVAQLGPDVLANNVAERIDLIDAARSVGEAIPGILSELAADDRLAEALAAYRVEMHTIINAAGEPITIDGEPITIDGEPVTVNPDQVTWDGERVTWEGEAVTWREDPDTDPSP